LHFPAYIFRNNWKAQEIMARPREFDEAAALDAAIQRFWLRGYEATSVRDLADEMGIVGASLYNAFGNKRMLFERSLNRYLDQTFRERIGRLEHSLPPRDAIVAFLREIIKRSLNDEQRLGCLLVNSALETTPHDRELQQILATFLNEVESFFFDASRRASETTPFPKPKRRRTSPDFFWAFYSGFACLRVPGPTASCWRAW
jgi:TetR/AcrR family transcriptional regulator, transcriptional repressor for nem operon